MDLWKLRIVQLYRSNARALQRVPNLHTSCSTRYMMQQQQGCTVLTTQKPYMRGII